MHFGVPKFLGQPVFAGHPRWLGIGILQKDAQWEGCVATGAGMPWTRSPSECVGLCGAA